MGIISKHCRKLVMEILFQLLLKGCTIEAPQCLRASCPRCSFQLLLKGCTIEAYFLLYTLSPPTSFQLLLKGCTIEAKLCVGERL